MASRFYSEQEPQLYDDQFGDFYYDPNTGGFVSAPAMSGIGAPEVAYYAPEQTYYAPEPTYYAPEQYYAPPPEQYYAPPPEQTYYAPEPAPVYYAPEPAPAPEPVYVAPPAPEPVYTPAAVAQVAEPAPPVSGLGGLTAPVAAVPAVIESARYSPETLAAYGEQQKYLSDFIERTGYDTEIDKKYQSVARRNTLDDYASSSGGDPMAEMYQNPTVALPEEVLAERLLTAPPVGERITSYFTPQTNDQESAGRLSAKWNTPFRLYDGNMLVYEGVGPDAAAEAAALAGAISKEKGDKADWKVTQQAGDKWITAAKDAPDFSVVDAALKYGLPLAVSFIPGLNVVATMAAAGAASTTGNLLAGESLKNALISGALSAATAGALKGTNIGQSISKSVGKAVQSSFPGIGQSASKFAADTAANAVADAAARAAANEIVVTASRNILSPALLRAASGVVSGAVSEGLSGIGNSLLAPKLEPLNPQLQTPELQAPPAAQPAPPLAAPIDNMPELVSTASRLQPSNAFPSSVAGISGIAPVALAEAAKLIAAEQQATEQQPTAGDEEQINILANRYKPLDLSLGVPLSFGPGPGPSPTVDPVAPEEEILVEASRKDPNPPSVLDLAATAIPFAPLLPLTPQPVPQIDKPGPSLKDIINTAGLVSTGIGLAGDLFGGGDGGGGTLDPGVGYTVGGIGGVGSRMRAPATFDPFTYGQKEGEFGFYRNAAAPSASVPNAFAPASGGLLNVLNNPDVQQKIQEAMMLNPAFAAPIAGDYGANAYNAMAEGGEVDDDMVSHLMAYRKGGGHAGPGPVKGIGSGQEDKIPAWLSDGEYVWSAQDVADLGDGSTDEGVRRLDRMRQMVRKGAGRKDVKKIAKPQRGIQQMLKAVGGAV